MVLASGPSTRHKNARDLTTMICIANVLIIAVIFINIPLVESLLPFPIWGTGIVSQSLYTLSCYTKINTY
jgi:hypothetical protein